MTICSNSDRPRQGRLTLDWKASSAALSVHPVFGKLISKMSLCQRTDAEYRPDRSGTVMGRILTAVRHIRRWWESLQQRRKEEELARNELRGQGLLHKWNTYYLPHPELRIIHQGRDLPDGLRSRFVVQDCIQGLGQVLTVSQDGEYKVGVFLTRNDRLSPYWQIHKIVGPAKDCASLIEELPRKLESATRREWMMRFCRTAG